jgi:LytS/YehU family sensor histidine kinase
LALYPLLYKRAQPVVFGLCVLLFVLCVSAIRTYFEYAFISTLFSRRSFFKAGNAHFTYVFVTNFVALLLGVLLKFVSAYFIVKAQQATLEKKRLETELKLLKAQLQPHFLFNSLNNIYYEAFTESPKTARLIEKLAGIMRYFFDINSKDLIPIGQEISFIKNYIEMEQIRCHYPIRVDMNTEIDCQIKVPPMLMTPLVENMIKHGIDKKRKDNFIAIDIQKSSDMVCVTTKNRLLSSPVKENGSGLVNLEERMRLLYDDKYHLLTNGNDGIFTASLKIPVK